MMVEPDRDGEDELEHGEESSSAFSSILMNPTMSVRQGCSISEEMELERWGRLAGTEASTRRGEVLGERGDAELVCW